MLRQYFKKQWDMMKKVIQPYPMRQINKRVSFDAKKEEEKKEEDYELNVEQNKQKNNRTDTD